MTDVRTYTNHNTPPWATVITNTITAGDLGKARALWLSAAAEAGADHAIYAVAAAVEPGPGQILVGEAPRVFGNPLRQGFAWRCGECLDVFRRGGPDPRSGVNYKTLRGAGAAARKHSTEGHPTSVRVDEAPRRSS
ncbi:hypothetical protein BJF79_03470 [Actinomadura sp. CNU-125]|uniref:hypothetical protein n=1 Tax=Actinomadura sp. CNU-125 TaxID=1904961 RepID=UPI000967CD86|nr:hypothetical protein [Actinomadura sp. CNU-125]OLT12973.1 hypothetical protein BJF79_03470 [Actinomadura sp. CNU-125]